MTVQRFLGASWAAVHGPADPRRLLLWVLDAGFRGVLPGPTPRTLAWSAIHRAAEGLPVAFAAVRTSSVLSEKSATAALASGKPAELELARLAVRKAIATAEAVGTDLVILEPGVVPLVGEVGAEDLGEPGRSWPPEPTKALMARRKAGLNAALDRVCRALYAICRANQDIRFCLTPGRSIRAVGGIDGLEAVFEDLSQCRLSYWHDSAVVSRREQVLGEAQGDWLERFSNRCIGCTLGDATADGIYQPPGAGGVDYPLLAAYLRRSGRVLPASLEFDPAVDATEIPGVHAFLDKFGL